MVKIFSDETLQIKANELRDRLGLTDVFALDMRGIISALPGKMKRFAVRRSRNGELEPNEAFMDCEKGELVLSDQVSDDLSADYPRARFTVAHEIGHYLLGHSGNTKRTANKEKYLTADQRIQEQQADLFASYLLAPTKLARLCNSSEQIKSRFNVSMTVATIVFERVARVIRKEKREGRPPVAIVLNFLKEAERRGHTLVSKLPSAEVQLHKPVQQTSVSISVPSSGYGELTMQGHTGNICSECGNFTMVRKGNSERCISCGSSGWSS